MLQNKRSAAPLLLAGLAAFAYYRFSKMSPEKKRDLKEKGKNVLDKYVSQPVKKLFSKVEQSREQFI